MPRIEVFPDNDIVFVDESGNEVGVLGFQNVSQSGIIGAGDYANMFALNVPDGTTVRVLRAGLVTADLSAVASGVDLTISDGSSNLTTVLSGDGSTVFVGETGNPLASYSNTIGSAQNVMIGVDNGNFNSGKGSDADVQASAVIRVE